MVFLDPSAAKGADCAVLIDSRPTLKAKLETIVAHILGYRHGGQSSMTFAIYGPWGAGKSSVLEWLRQELETRRAADGLAVTVSTYEAPLWQAAPDVRATLAYEIVKGMAGTAKLHGITQALAEVRSSKPPPPAHPDEQELLTAVTFMSILAELPQAPAVVEKYLQERAADISRGAAAQTQPPVHVQLVDDLDRCDTRFTASLLYAMNYWQSTSTYRVMFVVAASRDHIAAAIREHPAQDGKSPGHALEKYIHLSVDLPQLLASPTEVADYLLHLVDKVATTEGTRDPASDGGIDPATLMELQKIIGQSRDSYPNGLLAPVLRIDPQGITPRQIKHRLNALLVELRRNGGERDPQWWKGSVIRTTWPDFARQELEPILLRPTASDLIWKGHLNRVLGLSAAGRQLLRFWEMDAEGVRPSLMFLAQRYGIDANGIDPVLAMYLAAEPPWEPPSGGGAPGIGVGGTEQHPAEPLPVDAGSIAEREPLPPREEALLESILAERMADQGDEATARAHLLRIIELTESNPTGVVTAATLGNSALYAERLALVDIANKLHRAALAANPQQYNVMQNYVEFIIDNRREQDFERAEELLGKLRTEGRAHKPQRTAALAARLSLLTGGSGESIQEAVRMLMETLAVEPSVSTLTQLLIIGIDAVGADQVRQACELVARASTDDRQRYTVLRLFADELTSTPDLQDSKEAGDIYRFLLRTGLAGHSQDEDEVASVSNNLAGTLTVCDFPNVGLLLWQWIYSWRKKPNVRAAFGTALSNADLGDQAAQVFQGDDLTPLVIEPETLPARLAPEADAWWEELRIGTYPPTDVPIPGVIGPAAAGGQP